MLERRPVVIVSPLFHAVMITSAANRRWPDDIALDNDFGDYGLPRPSLVRVAKIASIDMGQATRIGSLRGPPLAALSVALVLARLPDMPISG